MRHVLLDVFIIAGLIAGFGIAALWIRSVRTALRSGYRIRPGGWLVVSLLAIALVCVATVSAREIQWRANNANRTDCTYRRYFWSHVITGDSSPP